MRRAFGLPQALLIILFVGGIVTVTMRYASLGARHYADSYTREQAELFVQSATETALLRIGGYNRSVGHDCLESLTVDSPDSRFRAVVTVNAYYLYGGKDNDGSALPSCNRVVLIQTPESHGMVDMTVSVTSSTDPSAKTGHPVKLVRRSLQRP